MSENEATRRNVLYGLAAAGIAVPVLAACGSGGDGNDATGTTDPGSSDGGAAPGGIKTSDIPVGGGAIFADEKIVVTQPTEGDFKAFSAVCTHQKCLVSSVEHKTINCSCHFSKYSIEDGSVQSGPAPKPLPQKSVTVSGDTLTVA